MDDDEIVGFTVDPVRDPTGTKLRGLLAAHFAVGRAEARRALCAQVLVVICVVLMLQTLAPGAPPSWLRVLARSAGAISFVAYAAATFEHWRWNAERARYLSELKPSDGIVEP
jgi:hypothetical protein